MPPLTKRRFFLFLIPPFLSGAAGISYEVLYGRMIGDLIGDQFLVSAAVLMTFLAGIGLGAKVAHYFWNFLGLIEAAMGGYALLFIALKPQLEQFLYSTNFILQPLEGKLLICTLLLLIPAFLTGCTLPLFSGYWKSLFSSDVFPSIYALYTIGSGFAALLIEFVLIRSLGIEKTVIAFAGLNFFIAFLLRINKTSFSPPKILSALKSSKCSLTPSSKSFSKLPYPQLAALIFSGIASAIFQLFMVKLAELLFGPFRESFALVLALTLFGIGTGALLVRFRKLSFSGALSLNLIGLLLISGGLEYGVALYASLHPLVESHYVGLIALKLLLLLFFMGFSTVGLGATLPALLKTEQNIAQESGALLFISALSNTIGFLLMILLLHRSFDYGLQLFLIFLLSVIALLFASSQSRQQMRKVLAGAVIIAGIQYSLWDEDLLYLSYRSFYSTKIFRKNQSSYQNPERFRGAQDVFSITKINNIPYFFINGYISIPLNSPSEKIVGVLSAIFAPTPDKALVLGLGSGATAGSVGHLFQSTEVVEINSVVIKNLYRMKQWNVGVEEIPSVHIIHDDGIHYVKSSSKKYDLILNTVTTPLYFSSSKLYTMEFLEEIVMHLNPDGIYVTWMDSRVGNQGVDIILKTLQQKFKYAAFFYIKSNYFLIIASQNPVNLEHPERLNTEKAKPLRNNLLEKHHLLPHWIAYNFLIQNAYSLIQNENAPLNTLDFPVLEFEMAQLGKDDFLDFKKRMLAKLNPHEVQQAFADKQKFDVLELMIHAENFPDNSEIARRWNELGKSEVPNFNEAHAQTRLKYFSTIAQQTHTAETHFRYAQILMDYGLYEQALSEYQNTLELEPDFPLAHFYKAASYEYQGKLSEAKEEYLKEKNRLGKTKDNALFEEIEKRLNRMEQGKFQ